MQLLIADKTSALLITPISRLWSLSTPTENIETSGTVPTKY